MRMQDRQGAYHISGLQQILDALKGSRRRSCLGQAAEAIVQRLPQLAGATSSGRIWGHAFLSLGGSCMELALLHQLCPYMLGTD